MTDAPPACEPSGPPEPTPTIEALLALHDAAEGPAVLKTGERGRVTRVPYDFRSDAVVKEDRPPSLRSRLGRRLRGSRGARAVDAAVELSTAGFEIPEPLGLLELPTRSVVAFRHVRGPTLSEAWAGATDPFVAEQLACEAATLTARLHEAGFAFRDLKPPNLIVSELGALIPVDLDDVRLARSLARRIAWRNLAALDAYGQLGPQPLRAGSRWRALETYARLRDLEPEPILRAVLPRSRAKRRGWQGS